MILCAGHAFEISESWLSGREPAAANSPPGLPQPLRGREKELIEGALARSRGEVAGADGAAAELGIPASTLESKIKQLGIDKARFIGGSRNPGNLQSALIVLRGS